MYKVVIVTAALIGGMIATSPVASAESCEAHLAKHGVTAAQDIAEHASGKARGESPCKGDNIKVDISNQEGYDRDYRTSRWEDKTSFDCGWSWRGGFGC